MESERKPRWYDEKITVKEPSNDIQCKTCLLKEPDRHPGLGVVIKGYKLGTCQAYDLVKPTEVLWENRACTYYIDENGDN